jgi:hypothetical protein
VESEVSEIQNCIVGFAGRKGSGKSTALRRVLEHCPRLLLWDLNAEHGWVPNRFGRMADAEEFLAWADTQQKFAGSYLPSRDIPACFERLCGLAYAHGRMVFAVEEATEVCRAGFLTDGFGMVVRRGRHRRLNLVWTCQRLAEVSITLRSQTDYFWIGSQAEPRDLDALAERCGREAAEKAAGLGLHGSLVWDVVRREEVTFEALAGAVAGKALREVSVAR